jgi:hypothetical protein
MRIRPVEAEPCTGTGFVAEHQAPVLGPDLEDRGETFQIGHLGNERAAALLGGLDGMGLKPVTADALGIGEVGLHRTDPRGSHLGRLFDDEVGPRLLDWRKQEPQVRRWLEGTRMSTQFERAGALARVSHPGKVFPADPVEDEKRISGPQAHDTEKVMRLISVKPNRLPFPERLA